MTSPVVAYCANATMAGAMRVSACALLAHLPEDARVDLHLVQEGWTQRDIDRLKRIVQRSGREHTLTVHPADLTPFATLPGLHGDRTAYARLLLPDLIPAERILYLDSDTLPLLDVTHIYEVELEEYIMGAVAWNVTVANALDRTVLLAEGIPADAPYFNSGVLLMDAECFRAEGIYQRCMAAAHRLGEQLISHDQTLLNLVLHGRIKQLRWGYNVRLGFDEPPYAREGLAHFVGALKPWDPFGRWLHQNASLWRNWSQRAGEDKPPVSYRFRRAAQLGPTYTKALRSRLK